MKILFVTDLCPIYEEEKGLPLTLLNFISDFQKLGHEVTLLRPNVIPNVLLRKRKISPQKNGVYKGFRYINLNFLTPFFSAFRFNFLKKENYDVILAHMPSGILCARQIARALKIPYFAAVHSSDIKVLTDKKYFFLRGLMKKSYLGAKNVVCRSHWLKDRIDGLIPEIKDKTYVIPSGIEPEVLINPEFFNSKINKFYGIPYNIFSAGSLIKRKNFESLIKAVSKLDDIGLLIAGDGPERENLQNLINSLGLKKRVKLLGQKSKKEVYEFMQSNPLFILPSVNETFGMVYLEAMAKGSVVVCSKNSGMAGFIKDGLNGFLTDPDPDSIAETIRRINSFKNIEEIMQNALNTAIEMDRLKMSLNYLNLIQNILF